MHPDAAKSVLLSALNQRTMEHLQTRLEAVETQDATYYSTAEWLEVIPYPQILALLKRGQLLDNNLVLAPLREWSKGIRRVGGPTEATAGVYSDAFFSQVATATPRACFMAPPAPPEVAEAATPTDAALARPGDELVAAVATVLPACNTYHCSIYCGDYHCNAPRHRSRTLP